LSDWYRTGRVIVPFCTGIRFVLSIAEDFSVSSCPPVGGLAQIFPISLDHLPSFSCEPVFR
jgi:hypothetical protein